MPRRRFERRRPDPRRGMNGREVQQVCKSACRLVFTRCQQMYEQCTCILCKLRLSGLALASRLIKSDTNGDADVESQKSQEWDFQSKDVIVMIG